MKTNMKPEDGNWPQENANNNCANHQFNHRDTEGTETGIPSLLRALCVSVVESLRTSTSRKDHFPPFLHERRLAFTISLCALCVLLWQFSALSEVHYVDVNSA